MTALQKIRSHGVLLVASIAVALALFVVGDAIRGGESLFNNSKQQVGEVDGESMSIQEYQELTKNFRNFYEVASQRSSLSESETNEINDKAWQNYVNNKLVEKECKKLGIAVTDEEVKNIIRNGQDQCLMIPQFMNPQTQAYDFAIVSQILKVYDEAKAKGQVDEKLQQMYDYYKFAQTYIRQNILQQKYVALLNSLVLSNPIEANMAFNDRNNQTDVLLASIPYSLINDNDVKVTDQDVKAKYDADKEKNYKLDVETRDIKVIDVVVEASDADRKAAEKEIAEETAKLDKATDAKSIKAIVRDSESRMNYSNVFKTKEAYQLPVLTALLDSMAVGTTSAPAFDQTTNCFYSLKLVDRAQKADSLCVRGIQVVGKDDKETSTKADSIVKAIEAGASFKDIAKKYAQTGDSVWYTTAAFAQANLGPDDAKFYNTLYSTPAGQTVKIQLSGVTFVVKVEQAKDVKTMYDAAVIIKPLTFSPETANELYSKLSSFVANNNKLDKFEANAEKAGYIVRSVDDLRSDAHLIAGIPGTHEILQWVFDTAKEGDVYKVIEAPGRTHVIAAALAKVNPKGYYSMDKMKKNITDKLMVEKKAEKILSTAKDFASASSYKGASVDTVKNITFAAPTFSSATTSSEPIISALASKTAKGQTSKAVKGNGGVFAIKVIDKKAGEAKFDPKHDVESAAQDNIQAVFSAMGKLLYDKANIVDNRYKFQ